MQRLLPWDSVLFFLLHLPQGQPDRCCQHRQRGDQANGHGSQYIIIGICRGDQHLRQCCNGIERAVRNGRHPDALRFLIEDIQQSVQGKADHAPHHQTQQGGTQIVGAVLVAHQQHQRPMPDAPHNAAQQAAIQQTELLLQAGHHVAAPADLLAQRGEHIDGRGKEHRKQAILQQVAEGGDPPADCAESGRPSRRRRRLPASCRKSPAGRGTPQNTAPHPAG